MSVWMYYLLLVIDNNTELELGNSTAASQPKAMKMLLTSLTKHLANDFRPEVSLYPVTIPFVLIKLTEPHKVSRGLHS